MNFLVPLGGACLRVLRGPVLCVCVLWGFTGQAFAQTLEPIRYTVRFPAPHTHYVEVEAAVPTEGRPEIDLMMPVWTPGSYLVREYSRHVEAVTATDPAGAQLLVHKTRKNRWRVAAHGARGVSLRYRVYANEMSVRTNFVDEELALLNGAATFMTLLPPQLRRSHEVRMVLPATWSQSVSGMDRIGDHAYVAVDYDALVDSPILAGNPWVHEFRVSGKPHYLVNFRERGLWNRSQSVQDLTKIAEATSRIWGHTPFDRFHFFNIIGAPVNALEHRNSTVMNAPRESMQTREGYVRWLSTAAHEYFHAWNVKRLRPVELGPFDYENEVYTDGLWFAEGVTDYYADLILARAGVVSRDEYFALLSTQIRSLQTTPGRLEQPLTLASRDAWIEYYRPDENSPNTAISYYVKGAVTGFLLDAELRRMTDGSKSLDDVMRLLYKEFSGEKGFTSEDLRAAVASVTGPKHASEVRSWLKRTVETTSELDYRGALEWFGLRMSPSSDAPRGWLGLLTRTDGERTIVSHVRRGSPAFEAGLSVGDEIAAIDGQALPAGQFVARTGTFAPGTKVVLSISRHDDVRRVQVVVAEDPGRRWTLTASPAATTPQQQHLDRWLTF